MAGIMAPTDSNKGVDNGEGIVHVEVENEIIDLAATFQIQLHKYEWRDQILISQIALRTKQKASLISKHIVSRPLVNYKVLIMQMLA